MIPPKYNRMYAIAEAQCRRHEELLEATRRVMARALSHYDAIRVGHIDFFIRNLPIAQIGSPDELDAAVYMIAIEFRGEWEVRLGKDSPELEDMFLRVSLKSEDQIPRVPSD